MIGRMGCYFENGKVKYWFKFASEITDNGFYDSEFYWHSGCK